VLYRLAKEHVHKADHYEHEAGASIGRRQREVDSCIATIVFVQAALEAWINWTAFQAGESLTGGLVNRWRDGLEQIAKHAGRPSPPPLSEDNREFLEQLSAWRNYVLHADDQASERLSRLGLDQQDLGAPLARETLRKADAVLEYGSSATGGQPLTSESLWPGFGPPG
jgi:hypothetical protein